jgi:hypothetical protein
MGVKMSDLIIDLKDEILDLFELSDIESMSDHYFFAVLGPKNLEEYSKKTWLDALEYLRNLN